MPDLGLGTSVRPDPADAAQEAVDRALESLGAPTASAAIVVSTSAYGDSSAAARLAARACRALGTGEIVGAGLDGLMVGAREWTGEPAVAVLALAPWIPCSLTLLDGLAGHEADLGDELIAGLGGPGEAEDLVLLFFDPHALDGRVAAASLGAVGSASLVGVAAGEQHGSPQPVWVGDEVAHGASSALRIRASRKGEPRIALTQAGRPVGEPLRITKARGHWILGLEGRPALETYRAAVPAPLRDDLPRAARSMLVAIEGAPDAGRGARGRRVRNVVGFDEGRGAFSVAEAPEPGDRLALVALDGVAARDELGQLGARLSDGPAPAGALYLNCRARASALFEHEGYELGEVGRLLGGAPVLGLMSSHIYGRAGPLQPLEIHTYAAIAALIDARSPEPGPRPIAPDGSLG